MISMLPEPLFYEVIAFLARAAYDETSVESWEAKVHTITRKFFNSSSLLIGVN
jgi:hypothetical protein